METIQLYFLVLTLLGYLTAFLLYTAHFLSEGKKYVESARTAAVLAVVFNTASLIIRTVITGYLPFANMFEFGLSFLWGIALVYLIIEFRYEISTLGMFVMPMAAVFAAWLLTLNRSVSPLMPALRSYWLYVHVFTAIVAYGTFAISFATALMYLLRSGIKEGKCGKIIKSFPPLDVLEDLTYKLIFFAMPFLTLVLITGAVWAEYAWGRYWSWDPKETWALITWLIYAAYLHARFIRGWKGKKAIILAALGFVAVIFTFLGVTFLLPGLHSYL